jgi:hypothetical protein
MHNLEFVIAGYLLTAFALGGYVARMHVRARKARLRAAAIAARVATRGQGAG